MGARQERSGGTQEQIVAEEVITTVGEEVFLAVRQHGRMCTEKGLWLACVSAGVSTGGRGHSSPLFWYRPRNPRRAYKFLQFECLDMCSDLASVIPDKTEKERKKREANRKQLW